MSAINAWIDNEVKSNDVVLFMKGTPGFPQCGFSGQVVQILDHVGVDYKGINVLTNDELRNGIKDYASLADHSAALCERRVCRRLRYCAGNVPEPGAAGFPCREGHRGQRRGLTVAFISVCGESRLDLRRGE